MQQVKWVAGSRLIKLAGVLRKVYKNSELSLPKKEVEEHLEAGNIELVEKESKKTKGE